MSYLVLARKWRPQNFEQLIGQQHVTTTLRNAIKSKRIAHAYLFSGARGVGKTSAARVLAKALNCAEGPTETPCNKCPSCVEITGSRSIDVLEIDGASNRGIDEIRDLRENVKYTPTQGKYKIYIIDEVHMLTKEAFNALLKTLEEPPAHAIFIFATTEIHKVPITILSRCQRFDFRKVEVSVVVDYVKRMLEGEEVQATDDCLYLVAQKSEGSMRDAISLLDQLISYGGQKLTAEDARQVLGLVDEALFFKTVDMIRSRDQAGLLELVEQVSSGGYDLQEFALGLLAHFRKLMVIAAGQPNIALSDVPADARENYLKQAGGIQGRDLLRMVRILVETETTMKRSSQSRLVLEAACLRLSDLDETVKIEELINGLGGDNGPEPNPRPAQNSGRDEVKPTGLKSAAVAYPSVRQPPPAVYAAPPAREEPKASPAVLRGDFESLWKDLVSSIKNRNMLLGTCLEAARPVGISDGRLTVIYGANSKFFTDSLENKTNQQMLDEETVRLWGQRLKLACQITQEQTSTGNGQPARASLQDETDRRRNQALGSAKIKGFLDQVEGEVL